MPAPVGHTSELYSDADNPQSVLGAPPSAPAPVPAPVKVEQPVAVKERRMADEDAQGNVRDTSMEAMRPGNDLGFRNLSDESLTKPSPDAAPTPKAAPDASLTPEPPKEPAAAPAQPAERTYAGKFKTVEELERGYDEAQKLITRQGQEKAALERAALVTPPAASAKSPEQLALEQAESTKLVNEFVSDPKKFVQERVVNQTLVALTAQQVRNDWLKANPDIAEHEIRVAFEVTQLIQSDPELARDPTALLSKATDNFRQFTGKLRTEGAKEALTTETRVIPLSSSAPSPAATEQPAKAPLTSDAAYELHLKMLKEQEQRSHRGLRR